MNAKLLWIGVVSLTLYVVACSHQGPVVQRRELYPVKKAATQYDVPVVYNDQVQKWISHFQYENHARFSLYLTRSGRYLSFMRQILAEEGLPQDLVYLALIESGFSNHAYSRAHAAGPWQFIRSTGRIYGLRINSWMDERRDPEKATRAAAHYLKKLYGDFGDWYLALAAYNAGEGRIQRAIHQSRSNDFWQIANPRRRYLKNETREYVPKFLAAMIIAKDPRAHGFGHVRYEPPLAFEETTVRGSLGLDVAADLAKSPEEEVRRLNPELSLAMTPPEPYSLKIPPGRQEAFALAYAQLPPEERVRVVYHTVRSGDSIWRIANRYGVSRDDLLAANRLTLRQARYLRPGKRLMVPRHGYQAAKSRRAAQTLLAANTRADPPAQKKLDGVEYMIRKDFKENGEEVSEVQKVEQEENPVTDPEGFEQAALPEVEETDYGPGTEKPKTKNQELKYVVKRGDNLWQIAKQHGVKVADLKEWNSLPTNRIHPGKSLVISAP